MQGCCTGYFTSNPKNHAAFAGNSIKLNKDGTFQIDKWTDVTSRYSDSLGNLVWKEYQKEKRIGKGLYLKKRDSLLFTFTSEDSITVLIDFRESIDSIFIELEGIFETGGKAYLSYELINNFDSILSFTSDPLQLILNSPKRAKPKGISLGDSWNGLSQNLILLEDLKTGMNEIKIKTYGGFYPKGDKITIWHRRGPSGIRYSFGQRKTWMPRQWKWMFLNKLYPNRSYPIFYGKKPNN